VTCECDCAAAIRDWRTDIWCREWVWETDSVKMHLGLRERTSPEDNKCVEVEYGVRRREGDDVIERGQTRQGLHVRDGKG